MSGGQVQSRSVLAMGIVMPVLIQDHTGSLAAAGSLLCCGYATAPSRSKAPALGGG